MSLLWQSQVAVHYDWGLSHPSTVLRVLAKPRETKRRLRREPLLSGTGWQARAAMNGVMKRSGSTNIAPIKGISKKKVSCSGRPRIHGRVAFQGYAHQGYAKASGTVGCKLREASRLPEDAPRTLRRARDGSRRRAARRGVAGRPSSSRCWTTPSRR
jgi:hypothetical protein